jgi:8-oxo-dGTP pyrophosphatase MutT (NUDIX family)
MSECDKLDNTHLRGVVMPKRIYVYLGRLLNIPLLPLLCFGKRRRVRVLVLTKNRRHVLLLRNWLGYQNWSLPGGGAKKQETDQEAAARELYEETGVPVEAGRVKYVGLRRCSESARSFEVAVYCVVLDEDVFDLSVAQSLEVIEAKWYPIAKLPKELGLPIPGIINEIDSER